MATKGGKRRESVKFVPKPVPYRICKTVTETGKTIAMTKRRIIWRYGWSDSELAHEVCVKDSRLSGKKMIIHNGREIYSSSSRSSFRHGWEMSGHLFRIELLGAEGDIFTIDTIPFESFGPTPTVFPVPEMVLPDADTDANDNANNNANTNPNPNREPMVGKKGIATKSEQSSRNSRNINEMNSQQKKNSQTFDPFASLEKNDNISSSSSSPASHQFPSQSVKKNQQPNPAAIPSTTQNNKLTSSSFDLFETENVQPPPSSTTNAFDLFDNFVPIGQSSSTSVGMPCSPNNNYLQTTPSTDYFGSASDDPFPRLAQSTSYQSTIGSFSYSASPGSTTLDPFFSTKFQPTSSTATTTSASSFQEFDSPTYSTQFSINNTSNSDYFGSKPHSPPSLVPLNPFETDSYPVFSSNSGPDPFFST